MKYVALILDGAAGWPLEELSWRTTLAAAHTPNLDALAAAGMVGLAQTVPPGAEPSSSVACTSILGYDPIASFVGRGAIEAASLGITLAEDEVALRMNVVHTADGRMVSYACGHITSQESHSLVAELAESLGDDTFRFYPGVAYRHILVVKGHPELLGLAYTPPHDITGQSIAGREPSGAGASVLLDLMKRARPVLSASPVNRARAARGELVATDIWPFWPGAAPTGLQPFRQVRGISAALTSGVDLLNGLAVLFGIDRLTIPGVTDGSDTDYRGQIEGALAAFADHDLVIVHVEAPDEEGHGGHVAGKIEAIEAIDREIVGVLLERLEEIRVLAMPDHPTPIALKTHVGEPVPFVLAGPGVRVNGATAFREDSAAAQGVLVDPGYRVMDLLLE